MLIPIPADKQNRIRLPGWKCVSSLSVSMEGEIQSDNLCWYCQKQFVEHICFLISLEMKYKQAERCYKLLFDYRSAIFLGRTNHWYIANQICSYSKLWVLVDLFLPLDYWGNVHYVCSGTYSFIMWLVAYQQTSKRVFTQSRVIIYNPNAL